jgi:cytochrome b561
MFLWNLTFLLRRTEIGQKILPGSRRSWVNWHVLIGLSSAPLVLLHAGFTLRNTVAGHSLVALILVMISGSFGRYFYPRLPRTQAPTGRSRAPVRLLSSWRLVHRWLAILLVVLAAIHVATSLRYASFDLSAHSVKKGAE